MVRALIIGALCLVLASFVYTQTSGMSPTQASGQSPAASTIAPPPRELVVDWAQQPPGARTPEAGWALAGGMRSDRDAGVVTAVDEKTITIAFDQRKMIKYTHHPVLGHVIAEETIIIPAQPPRKFTPIGPLAEGKYLERGEPQYQYRLSDVKLGDKVLIDWRQFNGVDQIHYVCILRRPGGKVPPSPAEKPDEKNLWHEKANAYQELEEKGTPLPEKFQPKPPPQLPPLPPE